MAAIPIHLLSPKEFPDFWCVRNRATACDSVCHGRAETVIRRHSEVAHCEIQKPRRVGGVVCRIYMDKTPLQQFDAIPRIHLANPIERLMKSRYWRTEIDVRFTGRTLFVGKFLECDDNLVGKAATQFVERGFDRS